MELLTTLLAALTTLFCVGCGAKIAYLAVSAMAREEFDRRKFWSQIKNLLVALAIALAAGSLSIYGVIAFYF